jgi:hypothetical protein
LLNIWSSGEVIPETLIRGFLLRVYKTFKVPCGYDMTDPEQKQLT